MIVRKVPSFIPPKPATERIANSVTSAFLARQGKGVFSIDQNGGLLRSISFVGIVHGERCLLIRPDYADIDGPFLAEWIGQPIEN